MSDPVSLRLDLPPLTLAALEAVIGGDRRPRSGDDGLVDIWERA